MLVAVLFLRSRPFSAKFHRLKAHRKFLVALFGAVLSVSRAATFDGLNFEGGVILGNLKTSVPAEASSLAISPANTNIIWTANDGSRDDLYAFRTDGTLMGTFNMSRSTTDVEDIAMGPGPKTNANYIYVGDIGSNTAVRNRVRIFRVEEPVIDPAWATNPVQRDLTGVESCDLLYPDATYNAEGLMVDGPAGMIYVVTKQSGIGRVYSAAISAYRNGGEVTMQFVGEVSIHQVSGVSISKDGTLMIMRQEDYALAWEKEPGESMASTLARVGSFIPVIARPTEPNGEAVAILPDASGYMTLSEGVNQPIYFFKRRVLVCDGRPEFLGAPFADSEGVRLSFIGCAGTTLAIDRATTLSNWSEIARVRLDDGTGAYLDPDNVGTRFYRLRVVQ